MGYFGYFGQDPTTDPSGGSPLPTDPSLPGSSPYGSGGSAPPLPGSGTSIIPTGAPGIPGSGTLPPASGGLQPYSGGSSTNLPGTGTSVLGGGTTALPLGQPWASAPVVRSLAASTTNGALFTNPNTQQAAWIQLALRQMIGAGYFDVGNNAAATGAIAALSQAYGYFMQMTLAPNDPSIGITGGVGVLAQAYSAIMMQFLSDAYASVQYWQSTPDYATLANAPPIHLLSAQDIYRAAAAANAAAAQTAAAAAPAAASKTMLYVGLAGAAGLAAYLAFA